MAWCPLVVVASAVPPRAASVGVGFAAGALVVMLADSMIPEGRKAGRVAGLATALGFAVAAGLSSLS